MWASPDIGHRLRAEPDAGWRWLWQNRAGTGGNEGLVVEGNAVANQHSAAFVPPSSPARFCLASRLSDLGAPWPRGAAGPMGSRE